MDDRRYAGASQEILQVPYLVVLTMLFNIASQSLSQALFARRSTKTRRNRHCLVIALLTSKRRKFSDAKLRVCTYMRATQAERNARQ